MVNDPIPSAKPVGRIDLTAMIVVAYVNNNTILPADLPKLLSDVHGALLACDGTTSYDSSAVEIEKPTAAQIRKSIKPDKLVSFLDGKSYAMLKKHLRRHGLDPNSYRQRFGLPADYPMTSSSYSAKRAASARERGLGRRTHTADEGSEM